MKRVKKSLGKRLGQIRYREKVSVPFLSGDAFASLCESSITDRSQLNDKTVELLSESRSLFLKGDLAFEFVRRYSSKVSPKIVVIGNSDEDVYNDYSELSWRNGNEPNYFLIQNLCIGNVSENYIVLPIGLENLRLGLNGITSDFSKHVSAMKLNKVLIGPYSQTHSSRKGLVEKFKGNDLFTLVNGQLNRREYRKMVAKHQFTLCPRGNGIDTHRFWESLYLGSVPIVEQSNWSNHVKSLGVPMLVVPSLEPTRIEEFVRLGNIESFVPRDVPQLWIDYWEETYFQSN